VHLATTLPSFVRFYHEPLSLADDTRYTDPERLIVALCLDRN
jgi:hypothetical protein